ncbi:hypothetical protein H1O16_gp081 [Burkholderia phage BcepSaruman]|uniref:Uncharacterized protein n=1 Tax=Burkholderia phage BcepSaruman TaxID=2530032 RepID=A0A4D5ZC19_9CAUD|nr:hypothetical protein H1O16_gp081 [Burkholderia phage BcepSaruman]QBX06494.1 hypothetical protein BcepSaruman_081 [Burkholderia phage BcepSaruman]
MNYNRSLDFVALAMDNMQKGRIKTAAKFFQDACTAPDAPRALAIIEASNGHAYATAQAERERVKAEAAANPENRVLAALGADRAELGLDDEAGRVEASATDADAAEFQATLAALVQK